MVTPTFRRKQPRLAVLLAGLCLAAGPAPAAADDLSSRAFQLKYDASGITSLKRTGDVADTDYIAANAALGRLIVRYRTSAHGDWKELRDLLPRPGGAGRHRSAIRSARCCRRSRPGRRGAPSRASPASAD